MCFTLRPPQAFVIYCRCLSSSDAQRKRHVPEQTTTVLLALLSNLQCHQEKHYLISLKRVRFFNDSLSRGLGPLILNWQVVAPGYRLLIVQMGGLPTTERVPNPIKLPKPITSRCTLGVPFRGTVVEPSFCRKLTDPRSPTFSFNFDFCFFSLYFSLFILQERSLLKVW